ncbi:SHOCT domain-containing protein [Parasphingorhabdus halotolerans]|uniref:SHOCT domain-containing protein n=1 Tax=Parasphingorhabdus halotolerans TaxID=2725558 RepID=A0A6H2DL54_9SPHN|nr:SHOCT domain-containing protein [Parasphingorhabdus halotolerans]QJB69402.1 SHOCT domain-containing protein [Parasphingorhabdus halotolerans]
MAKGKSNKHLENFRASKLKPSETIHGHLDGWIGDMMGKGDKKQHNGQFVLTDERACFYRKGILGEVFETMPLSKITSVESLSRMGYRVLRLHTSNDELAFKTFEEKDYFDETYNKLEEIRNQPASNSTASSVTEDIPDQIKKLADLKDAGILTDNEFEAKKAELLSRM